MESRLQMLTNYKFDISYYCIKWDCFPEKCINVDKIFFNLSLNNDNETLWWMLFEYIAKQNMYHYFCSSYLGTVYSISSKCFRYKMMFLGSLKSCLPWPYQSILRNKQSLNLFKKARRLKPSNIISNKDNLYITFYILWHFYTIISLAEPFSLPGSLRSQWNT